MKIDVTKVLKDAYGESIGSRVEDRCGECGFIKITARPGLTVGAVIYGCLTSSDQKEQLDEEANYRLHKLSTKIAVADKIVELDLDATKNILEMSNKFHARVVYGALRDMFEQKQASSKAKKKAKKK